MQPAIIIVSPEHSDFLLDEFGRYQRDYDLHALTDVSRAGDLAHEISATGGQVAMLVADSALGEVSPLSAFQTWRQVVPTAKRLVVAHWDRFLADAEALRHGLAKGKFDAYLLMPRGVRDEEFHTAVTELLSDWGSTVAAPEVETVRHRLAGARRADPADPRLPRPDGHAAPGPRPRHRGGPRDRRARRRRGELPAGRLAVPLA